MFIPKRITNKVFATKVLDFILDELCKLSEKFEKGEQLINRPDEQKYTPFYQCIGKAATLFAVMYKDKVKLVLQNRRFSQSAVVLDDFVDNFSSSFFRRVESCPEPWFPVIVLMYCGVFGATADVCRSVNRPDLVDLCRVNLELEMRTLVEGIEENCGWRSLYDISCIYAGLYDAKFWNNDSGNEQAPGPTQEVKEQVQEHADEQAQQEQAQVKKEPAQQAQAEQEKAKTQES